MYTGISIIIIIYFMYWLSIYCTDSKLTFVYIYIYIYILYIYL